MVIRKGLINDCIKFSNFIKISSHEFFKLLYGNNYNELIKILYKHSHNLFSYKHTYFMELNNKVVGMTLSYDYLIRKKEELITGLLILKKLGFKFFKKINYLIEAKKHIGYLSPGDYYLSNIAVLPNYRHRGIGSKLLNNIENLAKINCKRVVLDVETNNNAVAFYKHRGYFIKKTFNIEKFRFYRMVKLISPE